MKTGDSKAMCNEIIRAKKKEYERGIFAEEEDRFAGFIFKMQVCVSIAISVFLSEPSFNVAFKKKKKKHFFVGLSDFCFLFSGLCSG